MPDDVHPQIQAVLDTMAELNLPKIEAGSASDARVLMEGTEHAGGGLTRILYQAPGMQPSSNPQSCGESPSEGHRDRCNHQS